MKRLLAVALILCMTSCLAEDADAAFAKAAAILQESQSNSAQLVQAVKLLNDAAELYEKSGDDQKGATVNACLYWARKRMTLADTEALKNSSEVGKRLELVSKPIPANDAKALLDKADVFAREHSNDQLIVAIRYFEIADRFPDTEDGRKAMQLSLAAMQKVGEKGKLAAYKPAATDGKVFVQTEPPGASIILVQGEIKRDVGKKTPTLVQLPLGYQTLELELKGCKTSRLDISVDEKSIVKPPAVKMQPITAPVDVVFEPEWMIFVDSRDSGQKTPGTVEVPVGAHQVGLVKTGFVDVVQPLAVKNAERITLEPKAKPQAGHSALLQAAAARLKEDIKEFAGKWEGKNPGWQSVMDLKPDGSFIVAGNRHTGKWKLEPSEVLLIWDNFPTDRLKKVDKNTFTDGKFTLTRK